MSDLNVRLRLGVDGAAAVAGDLGKVEAELKGVGKAGVEAAAGAAKVGPALDKAGASAEAAASDFATLYDAAERDFVTQYQQGMTRTVQAHGAVGKSARLTGNEMLNLSRQFADVGVSAAGGISPLMILVQQGPQIGETFASASARGLTFSQVLRGIGASAAAGLAPLAPFLLAAGAAIGVVVGGFALFERAVDKQTKGATTFGETWQAVLNVVGKAIMDGPIGDGLKGLQAVFSRILNAIGNGALTFLERFVGFWGAAFVTIRDNWYRLPQAIGAILTGAANMTIANIEGLINTVIKGINYVGKAAGLAAIDTLSLPRMKAALNPLAAEFDKTAASIGSSFRKGLSGVFDEVVKETDKINAAKKKATASTAEHTRALKDTKAAVDETAKAFADLTGRIEQFTTGLTRAIGERSLTAIQKLQRELRQGLGDVATLERGGLVTTLGSGAKLAAEVTEQWAEAQALLNVRLEATPAVLADAIGGMAPLGREVDDLRDHFDGLAAAFDDVAYSFGGIGRAFKTGNFGRLINEVQTLANGIGALLSQGLGGVLSLGSAAANAIGGKGGRVVGTSLGIAASGVSLGAFAATGAGAAALGTAGLGAGAIAGIAAFAAPVAIAAAALYAAAKIFNIGGKPSNRGAGYDLVTGAITGKSRDAETEKAAVAAGDAIKGIQSTLREAGIALADSVTGLVIGTRDATQIYLASGKTLTSAVGDAGAAADTAFRALLDGATFVSDAQKSLVQGMVAAGKGFEDISTALAGYARAQGIARTVEDAILQLTDPKAFAIAELKRAQQAERDGLKAAATAGYLTAAQFDQISARLAVLETLQLDETLKQFGESVAGATAALRDQAAELTGSVGARIQELTDPNGFKVAQVNAAIDAKIASARPLIDAGVLGADFLTQLEQLRALELDAVFADLAGRVTETVDVFAQARPALQRWLDQLAVGPSAELSPRGQREVAVSQYQRQLARARAGDADALSSLTGYADQALGADRAATSSASARLAFANQVRTDIAGLTGLGGATNPTVAAIAGLQGPLATIAQASSAELAATAAGGKPVLIANLPSIQALYGQALGAQTDRLVAANDRSREEIVAGLKATADRLALAIDTLAANVGGGLNEVAAAAIEGNAALQAAVGELSNEQRLSAAANRLRAG